VIVVAGMDVEASVPAMRDIEAITTLLVLFHLSRDIASFSIRQ
jgi:hypothetical protein